jgi:hypothetical protein
MTRATAIKRIPVIPDKPASAPHAVIPDKPASARIPVIPDKPASAPHAVIPDKPAGRRSGTQARRAGSGGDEARVHRSEARRLAQRKWFRARTAPLGPGCAADAFSGMTTRAADAFSGMTTCAADAFSGMTTCAADAFSGMTTGAESHR